jgi:hypothetical protein
VTRWLLDGCASDEQRPRSGWLARHYVLRVRLRMRTPREAAYGLADRAYAGPAEDVRRRARAAKFGGSPPMTAA